MLETTTMSLRLPLLLACALLGASAARADTQSPSFEPLDRPARHWYDLSEVRHFGLQLDGGFPGGAGLAAVFRPYRAFRFNGGVNYDLAGFGVRGGASYIPFEWGLTPTLNVEGGHYFQGDASKYANSATAKVLLREVQHDFVTTSLGLEFGSQQRFVFFLRGGISWIWSEARNVREAVAAGNPGSSSQLVSAGNVSLFARAPSLSLGFLLFVY
jgi:hypothetical protein